jgi:hypothetical protein
VAGTFSGRDGAAGYILRTRTSLGSLRTNVDSGISRIDLDVVKLEVQVITARFCGFAFCDFCAFLWPFTP